MPTFFSIRKLLNAAHASAGACAKPTPKCEQHEPRLFMVEVPEYKLDGDRAILCSIDEIDGGAFVYHTIPYRDGCAYTFFQGGFI